MLTELSRQLDLLAQRPAIDGDLLILIVMAVFWLVGGLAKILANKKGPSQSRPQSKSMPKPPVQRETWQQRLARKARELQEAAEAERRTADHPRTTRKPEARPAGTITVHKGPKGDTVMVYEKHPVPSPRQKAVLPQEPQQSVRMPRQEISPEPTRPPESFTSYQQPPKSPQPEPLRAVVDLGLDDPDILRNAIVYSEILGKPLALRDTFGETARSESPE